MADFNIGAQFAQGTASMGDLMLRKRGQEEQSRQFNVAAEQRGRETAPVIEAAEMENEQKRALILQQGPAGKAFLFLADEFSTNPDSFVDKDGDGNPIPEVVGRVSTAGKIGEAIRKYKLDKGGIDMLMGLIKQNFEQVEGPYLAAIADKSKVMSEKNMRDEVSDSLDAVQEAYKEGKPDRDIMDRFDQLTASIAALSGQLPGAGQTQIAGVAGRAAQMEMTQAGEGDPPALAELKGMVALHQQTGKTLEQSIQASFEQKYGDTLSAMLRAYSDISMFALDEDDSMLQAVRKGISTKAKEIFGGNKPPQTTPSGLLWKNKQTGETNFPLLDSMIRGDYFSKPDGLTKFARSKYKAKSGYTFEQYIKYVTDLFAKEMFKGGWYGASDVGAVPPFGREPEGGS